MESKEEIVDKLLCIACLCVGRSLHRVTDERIQQFYLNTLNEIPLCNMPGLCPSVCWECAATLRKVVTFREQMKDSYRILMTYTSENLHECLLTDVTRPPRLRIHHTDPVSITPVDKEENDCEEKESNLEDVQHVFVKEELKNEGGDRLDYNSANSEDERLSDFYEIESEIQKIINSRDVKRKSKKNGERKIKNTKKLAKKFNSKNKTFASKLSRHLNKRSVDRTNEIETVEVSYDGKLETEDVLNDLKEESRTEWNHSDYNSADSEEDRLTDCSINKQTHAQTNVNKHKKKRKTETKERRARKVVKRLKIENKLTQKRSKTDSDQKILTIELSYEEMLQEREKECKRESYIRSEFKCESCLIGFNYGKSYKAHVSAKHSQSLGNYSCPICKTIISSVESFTAHYKRHMRRYECSICKKRTMDMKVMQQHYYSTHEISLKEYKCNMCGKISNSIDSHRYHKDTHKARVQCPECDKTFSHRAGLMNHRLSVHEYHNDFPCTVCDKVFRWKASLKRHLEKHDVKGKAVGSAAFCSPCGVSFSSVCSYQRHMKNSLKHVTQDQLKFICDHCNRRFADKTKLRDHIEEKHLHKTYQCHICLKPSKNRVGLDQHIRNVHKGRPNNKMCHHCGKGFPTKVQLESHIRTHTGERPFICEFCPTTFSQQSNLYKHNRQVHLNIKSKRYPCKKCKEDDPAVPPIETYVTRPVAVLHFTPDTGVVL